MEAVLHISLSLVCGKSRSAHQTLTLVFLLLDMKILLQFLFSSSDSRRFQLFRVDVHHPTCLVNPHFLVTSSIKLTGFFWKGCSCMAFSPASSYIWDSHQRSAFSVSYVFRAELSLQFCSVLDLSISFSENKWICDSLAFPCVQVKLYYTSNVVVFSLELSLVSFTCCRSWNLFIWNLDIS